MCKNFRPKYHGLLHHLLIYTAHAFQLYEKYAGQSALWSLLKLAILFSSFLSHLPWSLFLVFRRLCFFLFLHSLSWRSQILWWEGHLPNTRQAPNCQMTTQRCTQEQAIYKIDRDKTHKKTEEWTVKWQWAYCNSKKRGDKISKWYQ